LMAYRRRNPGKVVCWNEELGDFVPGEES
jgi:hypothetical protein